MKKLLLTTLMASALAGSVFAQGLVSLSGQADYATVGGGTTAKVAAGNPAQVGTFGQLNVAVFYCTDATPAAPFSATTMGSLTGTDWVEGAGDAVKISPVAGDLTAITATVVPSAAAAGSVEVMVAGWTGTYTSWNAAVTAASQGATVAFGWSGSKYSGGALEWSQSYAVTPSTPISLTTGSGGFNGMVLEQVPEPSTFALAGLGAAALMIFRRRK